MHAHAALAAVQNSSSCTGLRERCHAAATLRKLLCMHIGRDAQEQNTAGPFSSGSSCGVSVVVSTFTRHRGIPPLPLACLPRHNASLSNHVVGPARRKGRERTTNNLCSYGSTISKCLLQYPWYRVRLTSIHWDHTTDNHFRRTKALGCVLRYLGVQTAPAFHERFTSVPGMTSV